MTVYGALPRAEYRQQPKRQPRGLGFERYALLLDGVEDYVNCGQDASFDFTVMISVEAWMKRTGSTSGSLVGRYDHDLPGRPSWDLRSVDNNIAYFALSGIGTASKAFAKTDRDWHYFVGTYDGAIVKIYIDLVLGTPAAGVAPILTPAIDMRVGAAWRNVGPTTIWHFPGFIAMVRIYGDYALNLDEIKWNRLNYHNPVHPEHIVLWLPFEEGAGLVANDHSGHGNNGTILPALTPPTWEPIKKWELRSETE